MAIGQPATTVGAFVAQATKSIDHINQHRTAMAQVAAQTKPAKQLEPVREVSK